MPLKKIYCRFPEVALQWFQALLTDCEAPRHGVDLFGRDALLLGRCARLSVMPDMRWTPATHPSAGYRRNLISSLLNFIFLRTLLQIWQKPCS